MFAQTKKWIGYVLAWFVLMAIPLGFLYFRDHAGGVSETNQFTITSFDADYVASRNGDALQIQVTETITANFPRRRVNRGIERRLETRYGGASLDLSDVRVTNEDGERIQSRAMRSDDGDRIIRIGDPTEYVSGEQTYVITYVIGNAMVAAPDGRQEIYLDTNGTGWQVPIDRLSVSLRVDDALADRLDGQLACYQGATGATDRCALTRNGSTVTTSARGLDRRENVTIAIGFAPGTVARTLPAVRQGAVLPPWAAVALLPAIGLAFLVPVLIVRRIRRRTAHAHRAVVTQFGPPEGVEPIIAADLLNRPEKGAAAQLTRLVTAGMARLETGEEAGQTTATGDPGRLSPRRRDALRAQTMIRLTPAVEELADRGVRAVCKLLFESGNRARTYRGVQLGETPEHRVELATAKRLDLLVSRGLRRPGAGAGVVLGLGLTAMIIGGWFTIFNGFGNLWAFLGAGLVGVLLVVAAVYWFPQVGGLTAEGRRLREHLLGLQDFVTLAEADRIAWLQNAVDAPRVELEGRRLIKLYEPLLPYAIIFGVERTWTQVLGELYARMPSPGADDPVPAALPQLATVGAWAASSNDYQHHWWREDQSTYNFWDTRGDFGQGVGTAIGEAMDSWASSQNDDSGSSGSGGWFSGGGGGSSFSSGSSGGGFSGGGAGGGGGGGW